MDNPDAVVNNQVLKATTAIVAAGIGGMSWSDIAAMMAALYTTLLVCEWVWKRIIKPIGLSRGWIKPKLVWTPEDGD